MTDIKEALGIPEFGSWYVELLPNQNIIEELILLSKLVKSMVDSNSIEELKGNKKNIKFINYGKTQLVYVMTIDNSRQYTLLINQPATEYGLGKAEFNNLNRLNQLDSDAVIKPIGYFENNGKELYITPYYRQARCVGIETKDWGVWVPEPNYHFRKFTEEEKHAVNSVIVAMLVKLYDEENNQGLSKCRLDGGDFMLLKGYEYNDMSFENIMNSIKLIAARKLIPISLDDYIERIRIELSGQDCNEMLVLGGKLKQPFTIEEIEDGIEKGLELRKKYKSK